ARGVSNGAGPRAAHLLGRAPAALDDDERVEELLLPIGLASRLAPGERGQRREHRTHVVLLDIGIAIGRLDAPDPEHDRRRDAEILLDPREQRGVVLRLDAALA